MIDPKLFTVESLLAAFLDDTFGSRDKWRQYAEIVPNYMPPFPNKDTQPACVVKYVFSSGTTYFLRYSKGPRQGHFWDVYGEDYHTPELALMALLQAPIPPSLQRSEEWARWRAQDLMRPIY